jgi:hypothetical protein
VKSWWNDVRETLFIAVVKGLMEESLMPPGAQLILKPEKACLPPLSKLFREM